MLPKNPILHGVIGFILAVIAIKIQQLVKFPSGTIISSAKKQFIAQCTLLGDIGGTNIRLILVMIEPNKQAPIQVFKQARLSVSDYDSINTALVQFLFDAEIYPQIAVLSIAGPILNNSVQMANAQKWGLISGTQLGRILNITTFKLINDFQAVSYGLLIMNESNFIGINSDPNNINAAKTRGVMGPGTGLGSSVLYNAPFKMRKRVYVLPSQGGHTDFSHIDQQTIDFFYFLKKKLNISYINTERSFAGPTIPYMYQFYAQKYPQLKNSQLTPSSEQIMQMLSVDNSTGTLQSMVLQLFVKLYSTAICNFMAHHMPLGGVYLVGSLTSAVLPYLKNRDLVADFAKRHPQLASTLYQIPIVFSKEIDLGLKGAFVYAKRIILDTQS